MINDNSLKLFVLQRSVTNKKNGLALFIERQRFGHVWRYVVLFIEWFNFRRKSP